MSDKPRDLTLEQVNRLTQAVADLTESHAAQGASILRILEHIRGHLETGATDIATLKRERDALALQLAQVRSYAPKGHRRGARVVRAELS
jgi:hypothetical protein